MDITIFGDATASEAVAQSLNSGLTADAFWGALQPFMPVLLTTTLVALGYYFVRRIVKKFAKGKPSA